MAHFPNPSYWKVLETDESWNGGGVRVQRNEQIRYIRILIYKHGAHASTEKLKIGLYHDAALTRVHALSEWSYIADIEDVPDYWRGWLRFDFAREWLVAAQTYYIGVTVNGYTRNALTHYNAAMYEGNSLRFEIFSERKVSYQ